MASSTDRYRAARGVPEVHSREHAAQVRIVKGALLAEEVGQAQHLGRRWRRRPRRRARSGPHRRSATGTSGSGCRWWPCSRWAASDRERDERRGTAVRRPPWVSLATRMSPAPPSFTSAVAGTVHAAAYADSTWSAPPTTSAVPASRPVCLGYLGAELADPCPRTPNGRQHGRVDAGGPARTGRRARRRW